MYGVPYLGTWEDMDGRVRIQGYEGEWWKLTREWRDIYSTGYFARGFSLGNNCSDLSKRTKYIRKTQRFYPKAFSTTFLIRYPCMSYVHDFPVVESCSSRDAKARVFTTPSLARAFILLSKGSRHSFPGSLAILPNRFHPSLLPSIHRTYEGNFHEDI